MLERTAGCLENAGRRFFQDSNTTIRGRGTLYPHIRQHTVVLQQSSQRRTLSTTTTRSTIDPRAPFLEFLYPGRTQEYVALCLLRASRGILPRRRKRAGPSVSRTYVSEAANLHHSIETDKPIDPLPLIKNSDSSRRLAKDSLLALLEEEEIEQNDRVWELYVMAGYPVDVAPTLLARLSKSQKINDLRKAERLFLSIPADSRSGDDYLHIAKSYTAAGESLKVLGICQEATAKGVGLPCRAFILAHFVNHAEWHSAQQVWDLGPHKRENELWNSIASHLNLASLPKTLLDLPVLLQDQEKSNTLCGFARFFLRHAFSTPEIVENTPTETLLLLLQKYKTSNILTAQHYFNLIKSLQLSELRSNFIRSIVVYRNFRWLMDGEVPPASLLNNFLKRLAFFDITTGIQYFLDEFATFHNKPSLDAYKNSLIALSRAGDVANVELVFEKLVADHGKPLSQRILTPLLYVNARLGNVAETMVQFRRVSEEFGLPQNTVCWNILLTAYANADDLPGCFAQFKRMLEQRVEPSSHTFGILMGLCANRGDIDTVRQLLAVAKQRQVTITAPLLDTIVEAYCNNQKLDMAESVAETCLGLDVKGSRVRMWNMLLWNYAFRMDLESISRIRQRMDAAGLQPDDMTFAALMLSLVLLGQTDSARRILRTLHRSHRMHATEFHYAIILYGYVKDRNRDMVHIIFREIKARFNKLGLSSSLLVLKSQLQRDLQLLEDRGRGINNATIRLENAEKFLVETIAEFNPAKLATKQPVPGVGKQPLTKAFPAMYYEHLITAYGKRGASEQVRHLLEQFIKHPQSQKPSGSMQEIAPLRLLTALMLAHLKADQFKKVEECWKMAFPRARKIAGRSKYDSWLSRQLPPPDTMEPPRPSLPNSDNSTQSILVGSEIPDPLNTTRSPILPSYRFMLSRPLSLYMRSLAYRNEAKRIPQVVAEFEKAGFSLTTYNWSTFVQMLASSDKPSEQLEAFAVFERKFMPNFPGWNNLRRGYGVKPPSVPPTIDALENPSRGKHPSVLGKEGRRYWSKIAPDFMQPTYVSMVYLASALHGIRERSISDGGAELKVLHAVAPKTIEAIADMPYLREKFQGVLLRRRQEQGDKKDNISGHEHFVWTGGILGVGGRRRIPEVVEQHPELSPQEESSAETHAPSDARAPSFTQRPSLTDSVEEISLEDISTPFSKTIDYQDEYDLEAETLLATRRRLLGTNDELLDSEHREISLAEYQDEVPLEDEFSLDDEDP